MNTYNCDLDLKLSGSGNKIPVSAKVISSSEILGISIMIISLIIIFAPLTPDNSINFDQWGFSKDIDGLINSEQSIINGNSKIITKNINGKPHSITVKLVIEQKMSPVNTY